MVIYLLLSLFLSHSATSIILRYKTEENIPLNTKIADLSVDFSKIGIIIKSLQMINHKEFGASHFDIKLDGQYKLVTVKEIDRENLCRPSDEIGVEKNKPCHVIIKLITDDFLKMYEIYVEIKDINDNVPYWNLEHINVEFTDGDLPGMKKEIPPAIDIDSDVYSKILYNLTDSTNHFQIVEENDNVFIQNIRPLDRESISKFVLYLYATNDGLDTLSQLKVFVVIIDINDNPPKFSKPIFSRMDPIPENTSLNTVVLVLTAYDNDSGSNGEFSFRMDSSKNYDLPKEYFLIKPNTGEIILQKKLDYDKGAKNFIFKVIVEDHAYSPYSLSSEAIVNLNISDVNDESPQIDFYPIQENRISKIFAIQENSPVPTLIAFIITSDPDFQENDSISCQCQNDAFSMVNSVKNKQFKIFTKVFFDREYKDFYSLLIECTDGADHKSFVNKTLMILDVNDNDPVFLPYSLKFQITENKPPGTTVSGQLKSHDKDIDRNAQVHYKLQMPSKEFTLDAKYGTLISLKSFDREKSSTITLTVIVEDEGEMSRSSQDQIEIRILDVDDNPVTFVRDVFQFTLFENSPTNTFIGTVEATDPDDSNIHYFLSSMDKFQSLFHIGKLTGSLHTNSSFDREIIDRYYLEIVATDSNNYNLDINSPKHSSTATVLIIIGDENDNDPIIYYPNSTHNQFIIYAYQVSRDSIFQTVAVDLDAKENQTLTYFIEGGNIHKLFTIDRKSGMFYFNKHSESLSLNFMSTYVLQLKVCDSAMKPRCTLFSPLHINLSSQIPINTPVSETYKTKGIKMLSTFVILSGVLILSFLTAVITGSILMYLKAKAKQTVVLNNTPKDSTSNPNSTENIKILKDSKLEKIKKADDESKHCLKKNIQINWRTSPIHAIWKITNHSNQRILKADSETNKYHPTYSINHFSTTKLKRANQLETNSMELLPININSKSSFV